MSAHEPPFGEEVPIPHAREAHFRAIKVGKLVARLQLEKVGWQMLQGYAEQDWVALAIRARVRKPSPHSQKDVIGALREAQEW